MSTVLVNQLKMLAIGDALGQRWEFQQLQGDVHLATRALLYPPEKIIPTVTDDTQMSLHFLAALAGVQAEILTDQELQERFRVATLAWYEDPDQTPARGPGRACLNAAANYQAGASVAEVGEQAREAMGSGAIMRAGAFYGWALAHGWGLCNLRRLAKASGIVTHTHPGSVLATDVLIQVAWALGAGEVRPGNLWEYGDTVISQAIVAASGQTRAGYEYAADYYRNPSNRGSFSAPTVLENALRLIDENCGDPVDSLAAMATCPGDSDTVAAVGGSLLGILGWDERLDRYWGALEPRYRTEIAAWK